MSVTNKQFSIWAASMVASLAAAFAAAGASQAGSNGSSLCEIAERSAGGMVTIEAMAHAGGPIAGTYRLTVSGNGTDIRQGGDFETAGGTVKLGSATLGGTGGAYDVKLDVTAGSATASCARHVGGRL